MMKDRKAPNHTALTREDKDRKDGGFSFAELLVSCAIMILLAAAAVPVFSGVLDQVRKNVDETTVNAVQTAYDTALVMEPGSIESANSFDTLTQALYNAGYLKEASYEPQSGEYSFSFNQNTGKVSLVADTP